MLDRFGKVNTFLPIQVRSAQHTSLESFEASSLEETRIEQTRLYQRWSSSSVASWPRVGVRDPFSFNLTEVACRWWPPLSNTKAAKSGFGGLALRDKMARMEVSNLGQNYRRHL